MSRYDSHRENFIYVMCFHFRLLSLVEGGIVKYMLLDHLPKAEICPQQLTSTERQLRNNDLMTTYYVMLAGFLTSFVVFVTEVSFFYISVSNRVFKVSFLQSRPVLFQMLQKNAQQR